MANKTKDNAELHTSVPVRWRILGWLLLTAGIGLLALVVTVHSSLQAQMAQQANNHVLQETREFAEYAASNADPNTGQTFSSVQEMLKTYVTRQSPADDEVMFGIVDGKVVVNSPGDQADRLLELDQNSLVELPDKDNSGIWQTELGEVRWGQRPVKAEDGTTGALLVLNLVENSYREAARVTSTVAWVAVGALALIAVIGWLAAGRILTPIRHMRRTAQRISQEDLSRRIRVQGRDDLAELARTFNDMLDRIENSVRSEQRFVDEAFGKLREPLQEVQDELAMVQARLGQREGQDAASASAMLDQSIANLARMRHSVDDILDLSEAERPGFIEPREVELSALTHSIRARLEELGIRAWRLEAVAHGTAVLDPARVEQAVVELGSNAVQHTSAGDEIRLASRLVDEEGVPAVRFSISDDGPGVAPGDAERIFERFERLDETSEGTGLGLSLVRAIADAHGGWTEIDSLVGHGATFSITVPLGAHQSLKEV